MVSKIPVDPSHLGFDFRIYVVNKLPTLHLIDHMLDFNPRIQDVKTCGLLFESFYGSQI